MDIQTAVQNFLFACCLRGVSSDSYTAVADVYDLFSTYCVTNYKELVSVLSFMDTMEKLGYEVVSHPVFLEVQTLTGENTWRTPPSFDWGDQTAWHICFKGIVLNHMGRLYTRWHDNGFFVRHNITDEDREILCKEEDLTCHTTRPPLPRPNPLMPPLDGLVQRRYPAL